jgi:hypothetical protein
MALGIGFVFALMRLKFGSVRTGMMPQAAHYLSAETRERRSAS